MTWADIFRGDSETNRAERRKADQEWKRMIRRQKRSQARQRKGVRDGKD